MEKNQQRNLITITTVVFLLPALIFIFFPKEPLVTSYWWIPAISTLLAIAVGIYAMRKDLPSTFKTISLLVTTFYSFIISLTVIVELCQYMGWPGPSAWF